MPARIPSSSSIYVRILRVAGWNALFLIIGLILIAIAGEVTVRLFTPFERRDALPTHFVPGVGLLYEPGGEHRWTNHQDFWTISQANSLGFLDREPISSERAAESCHITIIGDSFVAARQVPIASKLQVRLEELAAQEMPELDVTPSAFGIHNTAQVNQLPFYDHYARQLSPKLLALTFTENDLWDNSARLSALFKGWDPDRAPYAFAERGTDGAVHWRSPSPDYKPLLGISQRTRISRTLLSFQWSELATWVERKLPKSVTLSPYFRNVVESRAEILQRRPAHATIHDGWAYTNWQLLYELLLQEDPPPVFREGREFAELALDEFAERARRDSAALVILSTHMMGDRNAEFSILLNEMAVERGIPIINQHEYITAQGESIENAHFAHDWHWNAAGHRWAAETLLEYLKQNQEICATMDGVDAEHARS